MSFPFPNPGCHILPRLLLFGGRKGRGRGLAVISTLLSPGQGHRNATGQKQLSSFMHVSLSAPSGLFSMGIFQMKSYCETLFVHTPTCALGPVSSSGQGRDGEMELCIGKEREREKEIAVGIGKEL